MDDPGATAETVDPVTADLREPECEATEGAADAAPSPRDGGGAEERDQGLEVAPRDWLADLAIGGGTEAEQFARIGVGSIAAARFESGDEAREKSFVVVASSSRRNGRSCR